MAFATERPDTDVVAHSEYRTVDDVMRSGARFEVVSEHQPAGDQPKAIDELERRIRGRGTDSEEAILRRLERARVELQAAPEFDARLVNGDLDEALGRLEGLMGLA